MQDQPIQSVIWIVLEQSPDGQSSPVCAFTSEELAQEQAAQTLGTVQPLQLYDQAR